MGWVLVIFKFFVDHPNLNMDEVNDIIEITDTRDCRVQEKHILKDLTKIIYKICDKAQKPSGILSKLKSDYNKNYQWDEIEVILNDLCKRKIMLKLDGYYLSIAVRNNNKKMVPIHNYPGGRLFTIQEMQAKELYQYAENIMNFDTEGIY